MNRAPLSSNGILDNLHTSRALSHSQNRQLPFSTAWSQALQEGSSMTCRWYKLALVGRIFLQALQVNDLILFGTLRLQRHL